MKTFLKLSIVCSLIGLFLIILLANYLEPAVTSCSEIDERHLDETVKVQGIINNIRKYDSLAIFTLEDETGKIDVVFYKEILFKEKNNLQVIGKVTEYNGKIELEAIKMKLIE